jgi:hypothetical protein
MTRSWNVHDSRSDESHLLATLGRNLPVFSWKAKPTPPVRTAAVAYRRYQVCCIGKIHTPKLSNSSTSRLVVVIILWSKTCIDRVLDVRFCISPILQTFDNYDIAYRVLLLTGIIQSSDKRSIVIAARNVFAYLSRSF